MASVTFPEALGGNGQTYTDDADPNTGLDGLGYTVRFIPCLQQAVVMGLSAQSNAQAAADYVQQCQTLREEVATDRQAVADDRTHIDQQKTAVDTAAGQVATDKQAVAGDRTHVDQQKTAVDTAAEQVTIDRQAVAGDRTHVDQQKTAVDTAAGQVATDRQAVSDDRLASEQAAGASSDAADASILARNQAEALYGDLTAVDAAKTEAQQAATLSSEERGLAETARAGAETAQAASEQAASTSQQAASDAVAAHGNELNPHTQYEKKEALKAGAYRAAVGVGDLYSRGGVVGPVSQDGGVPTGAVIERGSNANGEYTKFADGTLICRSGILSVGGVALAYGSIYESETFVWTFPHEFISSPSPSGFALGGNNRAWLALGDSGSSMSHLAVRLLRAGSTTSTITFSETAIGRWY
jgi:hypothetical protein